MSDDLVKSRLGYEYNLKDALHHNPTIIQAGDDICAVAKARIEELEAERDEALNQLDSARHSVEVLEKENARLWDALEAYAKKLEGHEIECPVLSGNTKKGEPKE